MAKKVNIDSDINDLLDKVKSSLKAQSSSQYIPNIIEFCESKYYLNLPSRGTNLFPMQKIILKTFYRGQPGNEKLELDEKELQYLFENKMDNVLEKYHSGNLFRELVLVLGRRGSKDFLVSLIALYEVMRLLEIPTGSPFKFYKIAEGNPIFILTVATSSDQAKILFTEIKEKMTSSEYFVDKVGHMESDKIHLLTPEDKAKQIQLENNGFENAASRIKGSVVIMSGHSNSESLLGKRIFCCAKGSMVLSDKGVLPIEEFSKNGENINETLYGLEGKVIADKAFDNGVKNTLIVHFLSGNKIEVTSEHKLYFWNEDHAEFKKASELKVKDYVLGQYGQNLWGSNTNLNFSQIKDSSEVHSSVLTASKEYVCGFLRLYFEEHANISSEISITSTSEILIRQIFYLLLNMGIFSIIRHRRFHRRWELSIVDRENILEYETQIGFTSNIKKNKLQNLTNKRNYNKFGIPVIDLIKNIDSKHEFKSNYKKIVSLSGIKKWQSYFQKQNIKSSLDEIVNCNLYGDQIVKIEESSNLVYDFHVQSESHSYCCNGLINHNSLLLDEVASFKTTSGATSGDRIYSALTPSTADFVRFTGEIDANGKPVRITDSKIISISSPRSEEGMLFKLWNETAITPNRLSFRLPTWKVNALQDEDTLRAEFKFMSPSEFSMEFGAEFSGTAGEKFIPDKLVDEAIEIGAELGLDQRESGISGMVYFAHLDPAVSSHNYALVVLHVEQRMRLAEKNGHFIKEKIKMYVVDHIKVWRPTTGIPINVFDVDKYIIELAKRFRFSMVSYDAWNSESSVRLLRSKGIPTKITPFRREYKMKIYDYLEHLFTNHCLALPRKGPWAGLLEMELKCLKRVYLPTGFKIGPNAEAQVVTDDVTDALSGACGSAMNSIDHGYPQSTVVYIPQNPAMGSNTQWKIGSGVYTQSQWNHYSQYGLYK